MRTGLALLLLLGVSLAPLEAQAQKPSFSVGIDLVGLGYDQVLVYFEAPLAGPLSADFAVGYSPGGLWNPDFRYWYIQSDLRSYYGSAGSGLYSGFGVAAYFAEERLNFHQWGIQEGASSVVLGVVGEAGYKYRFANSGFYIDPNLFVYALTPAALEAEEAKSTFQYRPFSVLGSLITGYTF